MSSTDQTEPLTETPEQVISELYGLPVSRDDYTKDYPKIQGRVSPDSQLAEVDDYTDPNTIFLYPFGGELKRISGRYKFDVFYDAMQNALPDPEDSNSCFIVYPSLDRELSYVEKIILCRLPKEVLMGIYELAQKYIPKFEQTKDRHQSQLRLVPQVDRFIGIPGETGPMLFTDRKPLYSPQRPLGLYTYNQLRGILPQDYESISRHTCGKSSTLSSWKDNQGKLHIVVISTKNTI